MESRKRKLSALLLSFLMVITAVFRPLPAGAEEAEPFRRLKEGGALVPGDATVSGLCIQSVRDGTPDFDADNRPGNDAGESNGIVRSFDSVQYTLSYTTAMKETSEYAYFEEGDLYVRFTLPNRAAEASFDVGAMGWLLDANLTEENGQVVLTGRRHVSKGASLNAIPGAGTLSAVVQVRAMPNGAVLQPTFEVWLDQDTTVQKAVAEPITVSAAPNYNVSLTNRTYKSSSGNFNPANGSVDSGSYGRLSGFGIMLQVKSSNPSKRLKGIELPKGEIRFRIKVEGYRLNNATNTLEKTQTPTLWDYKANYKDTDVGYLNHPLTEKPDELSWCPVLPQAKGEEAEFCTDSGKWTITQKGEFLEVRISDYRFAEDLRFPTVASGPYSGAEGIFSTGYLVLFERLNEFVSDNTSYYLTVEDSSLQAQSVTGQKLPESDTNDNQTDCSDDRVTTQTFADPPGASSKWNYFSYVKPNGNAGMAIGTEAEHSGDAKAYPGASVYLAGKYQESKLNSDTRGVDYFLKFDPSVFELQAETGEDFYIDDVYYHQGTQMKHKMYYVAKKDGKAWTSDREMDTTHENDANLRYYSTLSALKAENKTCIGVLFESRGQMAQDLNGLYPGKNYLYYAVKAKIKPSAPVGSVGQIENDVYIWTKKADGISAAQPGSYQNPSSKLLNEPAGSYPTYQKAMYNPDGSLVVGSHNDYHSGSSLLVTAMETTVQTRIANTNRDQSQKTSFDIGSEQRIVTFQTTPHVRLEEDAVGEKTAKLQLQVSIPKGLSYLPGSSYIGGVFQTDDYFSAEGHIAGGEKTEPVCSKEGEQQELLWTLEVPVNVLAEPVYYSCVIGDAANPKDDVDNEDSFLVPATVSFADSIWNIGKPTTQNGRIANASLRVIRLLDLSLGKEIQKQLLEQEEPIEYILHMANLSKTKNNALTLMDSFPYNGDRRHSQFHGSYEVQELWLDCSEALQNEAEFRIYYSTEEEVRELNSATVDVSRGWKQAALVKDENGRLTAELEKNATAFVLQGALDAYARIQVHCTLQPKENAGGDLYGNTATLYSPLLPTKVDSPIVQALVVGRSLSGLCWIDGNQNGIREEDEKPLPQVQVSLTDAEGAPAVDVTGKTIAPLLTKEDGSYCFTNLSDREYRVLFTSSETVHLSDFSVTRQQAVGADEEHDCDAVAVYTEDELTEAVISGIVFTDEEELNENHTTLEKKHLDAGFYDVSPLLKTADQPSDTNLHEGDRITYTLSTVYPDIGFEQAIFSDTIPEGLQLVPGTITSQPAGEEAVVVDDSAYDPQTRTIVWEPMTLKPGVNRVSFTCEILRFSDESFEQNYRNVGAIQNPDGSIRYESNEISHHAVSRNVELHKTAVLIQENGSTTQEATGRIEAPVDTALGQLVEYRIRVTQNGFPGEKSGKILVEDLLPDKTTFVEHSMTAKILKPDAKSTASAEVLGIDNENRLSWNLFHLDNGESAELCFRVYAPTSTDDPNTEGFESSLTFTNQAVLFDEDLSLIPTNTEEDYCKESEITYHRVTSSYLTALKSCEPASGSTVEVGDEITYHITVTNHGEDTATDILIRDAIPEHTAYVSGGTFQQIDYIDYVYFILDKILPGTSETVSFRVKVTDEEHREYKIVNVAQVKDCEEGLNPEDEVKKNDGFFDTNRVDHLVENPKEEPLLSALKDSEPKSGTPVKAGDHITYHIEVKNAGRTDLKQVLVRDRIPEHTSYLSGGTLVSIDKTDYVTFVLEELKAKETAVVSFQVEVTDTVPEEYLIQNTAQVKVCDEGSEPKIELETPDNWTDTNEVEHPVTPEKPKEPTPTPTGEPTKEPTPTPTAEPTKEPTPTPTAEPTKKPTPSPTPVKKPDSPTSSSGKTTTIISGPVKTEDSMFAERTGLLLSLTILLAGGAGALIWQKRKKEKCK